MIAEDMHSNPPDSGASAWIYEEGVYASVNAYSLLPRLLGGVTCYASLCTAQYSTEWQATCCRTTCAD